MPTAQANQVAVTLRVLGVPNDTPAEDTLYVAGDFNDWHAADPQFALRPGPNSTWLASFSVPLGATIRYKYTRGTWETAETLADHKEMPDRTRRVLAHGQEFEDVVEAWHDQAAANITRPMLGSVQIVRNFTVPQLKTTRRVWVYLPPDYKTSNRRYPVMYMHDGQNLFDETSFSGEWYVDRTIEELFVAGATKGAIVVAPDNGGARRLDEYSPWLLPEHKAGGQGDAYLDFMAHTLKPYIDASFRTLPSREYTALIGSSMGGLISMYGGLRHSDVFSRIGSFSPAFWVADRRIIALLKEHVEKGRHEHPMRIYLDVGGGKATTQEGEKEEVQDVIDAFYLLKEAGYRPDELKLIFDDESGHTESAWAHRFAASYLWLFEAHV